MRTCLGVELFRGELTQYTYPDGTVVGRSYTNRGELHQLTHAGTTIDTRVYDNGGRQTSSTFNNGVAETRVYGTDNTLTSISFGGSGTAIGNMTYAWDNNHNKTSETITGTMSNYGFTIPTNGYDSEDRLVSFNRTSGLTQSWNLSAVGDWNSVTTSGTAQTRTHGPTHELLTGAGQSVSTDVNGNITAIPAALRPNATSLTSTWDFDNRMVSADIGSNGSVEVSHQYDALGRRVARTAAGSTIVFVQAGQQTIADYVAGAVPASSTYRYIYASYIDEPVMRWLTSSSTALYYHRNQQFSVTAVTNSAGAVQERYAYSAYGVPTIANASGTVLTSSAISNRYMYTGREWDNDIQQYHYRARMYDASLGRFCSRDPVGFLGGFNLLSLNFPVSRVDPLGYAAVACESGCCAKNISIVTKGPFECGFDLTKYFPDYVPDPDFSKDPPFWGNDPDEAGPFETETKDEHWRGYKVQLVADFEGDSSCSISQHFIVVETNVEGEKPNKDPIDDFENSGRNPTKPPFRRVCKDKNKITWGDPIGYGVLQKDYKAVTKLTSCIVSNPKEGKKCEYTKCCIEWTFTIEVRDGKTFENKVVPGETKCE